MRLSVQRTHVARGHAQSAVAYRAWRWGLGGSPSIKYDESHHTAPGSWKIATDPTSPLAPALLPPPPHTAPSWVTWVRSPILYRILIFRPTARPRGGPGQDRRAAAKMPFRSAIRLAYSLHMRCRDLPWTDTSAVRSLTHTEQRNRCGLAALSTRDSPRSSCVARRGRAPARRTADRLRTSRPRCRTRGRTYPVTGFPDGTGTRPSAVLSRPKPGARVCRVDQWKRAREWNSYR